MKELMRDFLNVEKEINGFYESIFESKIEEFYINKKIKRKIVKIITEAKEHGDIEVMQKAIELIGSNTGCVEDVEVLNSLLKGRNDIKKEILANSPITRWLE